MAKAERKEVVCPFFVDLHQKVEKDGMHWALTKGMANHANAIRDKLVSEFSYIRCLDVRNKDIAQRVNANKFTCIFLRVFMRWLN